MADDTTKAQAFLCYTQDDDRLLKGAISRLRRNLEEAVQLVSGKSIKIFQDTIVPGTGQEWQNQLEEAFRLARVLIPILTPSFFRSDFCRSQVTVFLEREAAAGRRDLILPIYLQDTPLVDEAKRRGQDPLAARLAERQIRDWRELISLPSDHPLRSRAIFDLARELSKALSDYVDLPAPPPIPEQRNYYRFRINEQGLIDRAPDDAPDVDDADPELLAQQAGLLDACNRFLDAFRESGTGQNAFGRLINVVDAYQGAISGPLSQVRYSEVWRLGSRLQNAADAARRCIERLEAPELEDEQQAALDDLLAEHGPFILQTPAGREQQALADRFNATKSEQEAKRRAGQALNEAVQAEDSLFAEPAKQIIAEVSAEEGEGRHPERHAVIAETTYQNLLAITGRVAKFAGEHAKVIGAAAAAGVIGNAAYDTLPLAGNLLNLTVQTIETAKNFILANQPVLATLVAAGGEGFAWLPALMDWLKAQTKDRKPATDHPPTVSAPAIVKNNLWTPCRIFRDINEPWCPDMVVIPVGEFIMGSPMREAGRGGDEAPQRRITIRRPFAIGRYPVTFEEFDHFCDDTGRERPTDNGWGRGMRPVINVSYHDAMAYCGWLSEKTGQTYLLPREAEWEYACRAGSTTAYAFGNDIQVAEANFGGQIGKTLGVGTYAANDFGLYDMHGNVWEWCRDLHNRDFDDEASSIGLNLQNSVRVVRGGSWLSNIEHATSAYRGWNVPVARHTDLGFRCVRVLE